MCRWTPQSRISPDRLDAVVYALTDLMLGDRGCLML
jgi:phage terminase large subunit-like protein